MLITEEKLRNIKQVNPNLKVVALVPMRHVSERVPGKNYRNFAGKPLFHVIVETLLASKFITEVAIDTDSPLIIDELKKHFPKVKPLLRPEHLRRGEIPMNDILLHDISQTSGDVYLQTHATNPLLETSTVDAALGCFLEQRDHHDSLFSVTNVQKRFWNAAVGAVNHDPKILLRTQDLPPLFEENSCIYVFTPESLDKYKTRIGQTPLMLPMSKIEAWDIDDEEDFQIAEAIYQIRHSK